jgi:hypothetical protein
LHLIGYILEYYYDARTHKRKKKLIDGRSYQLRLLLELRPRGQVETYHTENAVEFLAVHLFLMENAFFLIWNRV